ncbi:TIGR00297 family protein [uncultured Methanobrevibacter sp.]|uniref:TIGR00297 family protein n=1 Tax=uncultured Methanobrevibacter sp. TaxID=253161 RepID=UPI0026349136
MQETLMINWGYVVLLFILGVITYKRKSLDLLGSLIMIFMGVTIIFSAGVNWLILIVLFLILSLFATRFAKPYKSELGEYEGTRTAKNVISNGLIAFLMAAFGGYYLPLVGGFIGAVATATADTLASEIGVLQEPRLITSFEKVPAGTDGAISILGTSAGIVGAGVIGFAAFLLGIIGNPLTAIKISVIAGTIGCFVDSILGAVLERKGWINNEHVNLLATACGALIGVISVM